MKTLFYTLISSALVTICPFLMSFEKGQFLTRGLFEYGIFATFLLYTSLRSKYIFSKKKKIICFFTTYIVLVTLSYIDISTMFLVKHKTVSFHAAIPLATCLVALVLLKDMKGFSLRKVSAAIFFSLLIHLGVMKLYPEQPLFQFSVPLYLAQHQPNIDWSRIPDSVKQVYHVTDSVSITHHYTDTTRNNVIVLVESWGTPMDFNTLKKELSVFNEVLKEFGIHFRTFCRTGTAEHEDLLESVWQDSTGRRDSLFLPERFSRLGYRTSFFFGGDSTIQWRYKYIRNIGFQDVFWTNSATADVAMASKIDSLLSTSACDLTLDSACLNRHFIAWTTRDTRFPISDDAVETEKLYYERLLGTLQMVADLAKKHPDVRFVVQGDHEPILSPLEFQRKFYRRWVPYVVLN